MANRVFPRRRAYHDRVPGSRSTADRAPWRKRATSSSAPSRASSGTCRAKRGRASAAGTLRARMSAGSISGNPLRMVKVFTTSARPTVPNRCFSRPALPGKVSKMAKSAGPKRSAYQCRVSCSCSTGSSAPRRNSAASSWWVGPASMPTNSALCIFSLLVPMVAPRAPRKASWA
ncbi:hypothetical protein WR25_00772 [Diploscapter pachys]|uniref:Uncharacterized protein n=1 Tax=Diploscapter pachys TaxID=2018661 RepID=A0A2A2M372_9BILA|nr:hypothetical protein WR25_00772 [Diploscapter pachys]